MTDVLFVNPPSPDRYVYIRDLNRSGRRSRERTIWPQTSLAYLAAVAKEEGYCIDIVDCIAERMNWQDFKKYLEQKHPRYIVTNAITSVISNDLYTTYLGKFLGAKTIAVGPHITSLPKETMERFPSLDFGITGEAEITIQALLSTVERSGNLAHVKGIVYRDRDGSVRITEKRPLIKNLDDLPIPLHELLPISKHCLPYIGSNYTFVLASRGCPYLCTFCRQPIMWERVVRMRSAKSILKELEYLTSIGVHNIMFHADTFTIDRTMVMELCNEIIRNKLKIRWICNSRVDTVDEEMLLAMKKAGCWMIAYGIESGNDEILKNVKKGGNATVEQARKAVLWTKKAGIGVWAYFIIGLPGENETTIRETVRFSKSIPADIINFAIAAPYPGTELYRQAKTRGWLESEKWEDFDQNYSSILSYENLSSQEIKRAIERAYKEWYLRPYGILAFIKGISSWNDVKSLLGIGWDHLRILKER